MPGEGHASPYLAEFAPHERQGKVEPELGPSTAPGTAYATVTSNSPSAAGLWAWCQRSTRSRGRLDLSTEKHR
jgi:hypothetical protein